MHQAALSALFFALASGAAAEPCPDPRISVTGADAALGERICAVSASVAPGLEACGLPLAAPLVVEVVGTVTHPLGDCLAAYDCTRDVVRVSDPATWPDLLGARQPYALLPEDVLLAALLTHEMAHALALRAAPGLALVDQEYIAAALELDLMDPAWRQVLTNAAPVSLPPREGLITQGIYALAPRKFATNAWQHFSLPEHGCGLVRSILAGEASFAVRGR